MTRQLLEEWSKTARKWAIDQRIKELTKALKRWPNSILVSSRIGELEHLKKALDVDEHTK